MIICLFLENQVEGKIFSSKKCLSLGYFKFVSGAVGHTINSAAAASPVYPKA